LNYGHKWTKNSSFGHFQGLKICLLTHLWQVLAKYTKFELHTSVERYLLSFDAYGF